MINLTHHEWQRVFIIEASKKIKFGIIAYDTTDHQIPNYVEVSNY